MKKTFNTTTIIVLILTISFLGFVQVIYAANKPSTVKVGGASYIQAKTLNGRPGVICESQSFGDQTNLSLLFNSAKKSNKTAFISLNINLSNQEFSNLMTGDTIDFQHGNDFTNTSQNQKVFFTFSEGTSRKSMTQIVSVTKSSPFVIDSNYQVMGSVMVLNKREDGCLDVSFDATAQNSSITKSTVTIDPKKKCIQGSNSQKLKSIPSLVISGSLYPEKFSGSSTSDSNLMLCDSGIGTSSGFTIPDFPGGTSSGFTIPDFPDFPGGSSGFTIPDFPGGTSGFTIPDFPTGSSGFIQLEPFQGLHS